MELLKDIIIDNYEMIIVVITYFVGGLVYGALIYEHVHKWLEKKDEGKCINDSNQCNECV